jgi:UDP-N-acetyl-D-mannosaminuronic acid transferase (WecB/TagA/CpsF family)
MLKQRGKARGLALCVGASLNFLTGEERRAPSWMRRCGVEWLYRLLQDPRRLAARYLWRGPRVFGIMARSAIVARKRLFTVQAAGPDVRPHRTGSVVPATQRRTG